MQPTAFEARRPWLLVVLIVTSIAGVNVVAAGVAVALPDLPPAVLEMIVELALAVLAIVLLTALRAWRKVGFRAPTRLRDLRLYWLPLFPVLPAVPAAIIGISAMRPGDIIYFLVLACLIGFVEEVFFRGVMLQALAPTGLWKAAILSAVVFGAMHLLNLLFGADLAATLLQSAYAAALGFGFAAVTLRTGILWPLIVIHALIDFTGFVASDGTVVTNVTSIDILIYALYIVVFTAYGIFMMRSVIRRVQEQSNTKTTGPADHDSVDDPAGPHATSPHAEAS
jgi:membrane protease YdiL (CAAX protease family)